MAGVVISYGGGLLDSVFGKSQAPIAEVITQKTEQFQKESQIDKIFKMTTSKRYAEKFTSLTSGHGFDPVGEGGAYPDDEFQEGYSKTLSAETWKDQFTVTQEAVEDDLMGEIKKKASNFTLGYNRSRENFAAHILWGGIGTSISHGNTKKRTFDTSAADGVAMFSAAHTSKTGGYANQSNLFANAFSVDALSAVQEKMFKFRDDDGNLLNIMPDTIVIGTSPTLFKAVMAAIGSEMDPDTANNAINYQCGLWNVIRWPYLDVWAPSTTIASTAWFLMDSKANDVLDGAVFQDRVNLTVRSDIEANDNNVWKGRARFSAGFVDWRPWAVSYATSGGSDATT